MRYSLIIILLFVNMCNNKVSLTTDNAKKSIVKNQKTNFCRLIDSLANQASSLPYDTYRGTAFLKKKNNNFLYHFYEDYPEKDDEGFYNGGQVNIAYVVLRNSIDHSEKIKIFSDKDTLNIKGSDFQQLSNKISVIDLYDFLEEPFLNQKIDFKILMDSNIEPILIGTYWANLNDDYAKSKNCEKIDFGDW